MSAQEVKQTRRREAAFDDRIHKDAAAPTQPSGNSKLRAMEQRAVELGYRSPPPQDEPAPTRQPKPMAMDHSGPAMGGGAPAEEVAGLRTEEVSGEMGKCRSCQRSFFLEKLDKHERVCQGIKVKKYVKSELGACAAATASSVPEKGKSANQKRPNQPCAKAVPKWKRESDALKQAMRSARAYTVEQKTGKKPKGAAFEAAPAPPDPDLVECPHCGRRFREEAAERHIAHCKNSKTRPKRLMKGSGIAAGGHKGAPKRR